jgi:hypothetical protein
LPRASSSCSGLFFGSCSPPPLLSEEVEAAINKPQMVRCLHGEKSLPNVACRRGWLHDHRMERDRTKPATPDLFSTGMVQDGSPPTRRASAKEAPADTASQRHVLPRDLPNAVKYLTDTELDLLITTSVQEAKRRGRLPASAEPNPTDEPVQKQSPSRQKGQAEATKVSLTRGQVNAVRAATKAGIKPSQIARQFGISQSDVRKVLASDAATQKRTRDCRDS